MLHGFPDLWQGWQQQIPVLAEAGFRTIAPNQRGYGGSDKPLGISSYDLDELAQDVIDLADHLDAASVQLVGHDWGGIIAYWVAARWPERVARLAILNAPHPGVFWRYLRRSPTQIARSWYAAFFQAPWLPEAILRWGSHELLFRSVQWTSPRGVFGANDRSYLTEGWSQPGSLTAMLNYYRAAARRTESSLQLRVTVPTLILFGCQDPVEEPGLATASQALCDDSRLVWLPEAGHWIQREASGKVNEELLRFLVREN
ncbi:MAG TPA: alpha/beta hydrolase [Planctomycetaceae bacterium]|nr:alpha/beta hydrolase [Planctomycetaceae bacterium]